MLALLLEDFKMKKIITAAGVCSIAVLLIACGNGGEEIHPEYKQITEAVYASGYIMPQQEYQVFSLAEGYLGKKLVAEGAEVTEGEPLFIIEGEQQDIRYNNAASVYEVAKQNYGSSSPALNEARSAMDATAIRMHNDSVNYIRYKNLWENNATSKMAFDNAELAYKTSQNEYKMRVQQYERLKNQLYVELQNAQSQLDLAQEDKNNYVLKSNVNGMVYQTYKEEGELVRRGEPLALLGQKDKVYLQLTVDELDIKKIKEGQEVLVKADVYGDRIFKAKISKIYPMLNRREQSFRVDAEFDEMLPDNFAGLSVEANIVIAKKDSALVVPRSLLVDKDSVVIKVNGEERKVKLQKGLETLEYVEVLGMDENTTLIVR